MDDSRQQTAMIKIGTIQEINTQTAKAIVFFEDLEGLTSDWLPFVFAKTLKDQFYAMPDAGEHVACVLDENFETGVILGAVYDEPNPPKSPSEDIDYIEYANGTKITVDHSTGDIEIDTPGKVTIKASSVHIDAPEVEMTGHLSVKNGISSHKSGKGIVSTGDVVARNISLVEHVHGGVMSGGSQTSKPIG